MSSLVGAVLAASAGAALIGWAAFDPRFRDGDGVLIAAVCLPVGIGSALMIAGLRPRLRQAAFWSGLLIAGQAVALQMIAAGPTVRYQHYEFLPMFARPELLVFVAGHGALAGVGLWRRRSVVLQVLGTLTPIQWGAAGLLLAVTSAAWPPPNGFVRFALEVVFASAVQIVSLATLLLAIDALPSPPLARVRAMLGRWRETSVARVALIAAAFATAGCALLAVFVYDRHPHVGDEVNYLYMARYFAAGMLALPLPPVPDAFPVGWMDVRSGEWFSAFPPGWPAILAIGAFWDLAWLVNPLLAGCNVLLAAVLTGRLYGPTAARAAAALMCVSPWWLFLGMSFMPHHASLACALVAAIAVGELIRGRGLRWAWLAGAATGLLGLMRPLEGLIVAVALGWWMLGVSGVARRLGAIASFGVACGLVAALVLPYNMRLTGDPLRMPLTQYADRNMGPGTNRLGFGPDRGWRWTNLDPRHGHDALDAAMNANFNLSAMNVELFGWSTGSLWLAALFLFAGRKDRADRLVLKFCGLLIGAHSVYWFSGGPDFGARYWFLLIVPAVLLTVRGTQVLAGRLIGVWDETSLRLAAAAALLAAASLVNFMPWRALDKYQHYRGMRADLRELRQEHGFANGLVLIQGRPVPDFLSAVIYNPLNLDAGAPIYALDRNTDVRAALLQKYGNRPVWIVQGPSVTGRGFQVVAGPLTRDQVIARLDGPRAAAASLPNH